MIALFLFIHLLASTPAAGAADHLSGGLVLEILAKIFAFVLALVGAFVGGQKLTEKRAARQRLHLESPIPEVPMRKVTSPPSYDQHQALAHRVGILEGEVKEIRREQGRQFEKLLEAGTEREGRLGEKIDGIASQLTQRIDQVLSSKPPIRR